MNKKTLLVSLLSLAVLTACGVETPSASTPASETGTSTPVKEDSSAPAPTTSTPAPSSKPVAHSHSYANDGAKVGDAQPLKCSCGNIGYDLLAEGKATAKGEWVKGKLKGDLEWNVTGIQAGKYQVFIKGTHSSGNATKSFLGDEVDSGYTSRYTFQVGTAAEVAITNESSYGDLGWAQNGNGDAVFTNASLCEVTIPENTTTFAMRWHAAGYSAYIDTVRLLKAPA